MASSDCILVANITDGLKSSIKIQHALIRESRQTEGEEDKDLKTTYASKVTFSKSMTIV